MPMKMTSCLGSCWGTNFSPKLAPVVKRLKLSAHVPFSRSSSLSLECLKFTQIKWRQLTFNESQAFYLLQRSSSVGCHLWVRRVGFSKPCFKHDLNLPCTFLGPLMHTWSRNYIISQLPQGQRKQCVKKNAYVNADEVKSEFSEMNWMRRHNQRGFLKQMGALIRFRTSYYFVLRRSGLFSRFVHSESEPCSRFNALQELNTFWWPLVFSLKICIRTRIKRHLLFNEIFIWHINGWTE